MGVAGQNKHGEGCGGVETVRVVVKCGIVNAGREKRGGSNATGKKMGWEKQGGAAKINVQISCHT